MNGIDKAGLGAMIDGFAAAFERGEPSPETLNDFALAANGMAAECAEACARMEHRNATTLAEIRDEIMEREGLAATPAEKKAREGQQYIEYKDEQAWLDATAKQLAGWSRYFNNRIQILARTDALNIIKELKDG